MKEQISKILEKIELREGIKILFSVENGSRAWRLESEDSDYDVRFVYVRPQNEYLVLNKKPDVITDSYNKDFDRVPQEGCYIDIMGFDIFKFCKMLSSSNPTTIEWLMSDIIYYGEKPKELIEWSKNHFNPKSVYWHYKSMCKQNYEKYIKTKNQLAYKKYLYAMRGLVNAKWISKMDTIPKISFPETVFELEHTDTLDTNVAKKITWIIKQKKEGKEKNIEEMIPDFDSYIELYLKDDSDVPTRKVTRYDNELQTYIDGLWDGSWT